MDPILFVSEILIFLFSIIAHEVMHGYVALRFGDDTAERAGRLTFNPIPHIDPVGSIALPFLFIILPMILGTPAGVFIAWAKPVPVNPLNFSDLRKGELFVSAAGIVTNLTLALVAALLYHLIPAAPGINLTLLQIASFTFTLNLLLAIFNLIPIPPLDGSKILLSQLPYNLAKEYEKIAPYGIMILFALLWVTPVIGIIIGTFINSMSSLFNIPPKLF